MRSNPFGVDLPDQIVGASFDRRTEAGIRRNTRYAMVQQLTFDPTGMTSGSMPGDHAVILAFGREPILDLQIGNQAPRRNGNVLYYVPVDVDIAGQVTFSSDLLRRTIVDADAMFFEQDRQWLGMGAGTATLSYRPIPFIGSFVADEIQLSLGTSGNGIPANREEIEPVDEIGEPCTDVTNTLPKGCEPRRVDFLPEVEVFDITTGAWARLPRMTDSRGYSLASPERYVDPATGQVLVRFVNDSPDQGQVGFIFELALVGAVQ